MMTEIPKVAPHKRCEHVHVSGRRCSLPAARALKPDAAHCAEHLVRNDETACADCAAMRKAFGL